VFGCNLIHCVCLRVWVLVRVQPDETWKDLKKLGYNEQLQLTQ